MHCSPGQKMALLLENNSPVRLNRAIFISFYLKEEVARVAQWGGWKKRDFFFWSRAESIVYGTADLYALRPREATYSIIAEIPAVQPSPCTFTGLSSAQYPICQDGELNMSILLHLAKKKKNAEQKAREVSFSISTFPFFLHCSVITGPSALHCCESFIGEVVHCTWRKSARFSSDYSCTRYCVVSRGKLASVFLLDYVWW